MDSSRARSGGSLERKRRGQMAALGQQHAEQHTGRQYATLLGDVRCEVAGSICRGPLRYELNVGQYLHRGDCHRGCLFSQSFRVVSPFLTVTAHKGESTKVIYKYYLAKDVPEVFFLPTRCCNSFGARRYRSLPPIVRSDTAEQSSISVGVLP